MMKKTIKSIATTKNIPTPIPALKISPITEQLENDTNTTNSINTRVICFCMFYYLSFILVKVH